MLFRIDFDARKQNPRGNLAQMDVSRLAGACWKKLSITKQQVYKDMANRERERGTWRRVESAKLD